MANLLYLKFTEFKGSRWQLMQANSKESKFAQIKIREYECIWPGLQINFLDLVFYRRVKNWGVEIVVTAGTASDDI